MAEPNGEKSLKKYFERVAKRVVDNEMEASMNSGMDADFGNLSASEVFAQYTTKKIMDQMREKFKKNK